MQLPRKKIWTLLLLLLISVSATVAQDYEDEETEESSARVARISVVEGESKITRIDSEEPEGIIDNLPVVEGDLIETGKDAKLEIQLDRYSFLRLDEDSILKFTFLADDGIALSLSKGSLGVTLIQFEKKDTYFEIDAPDSTIAIQKNGSYRIDAGDEYNKEVRVAVRDEGEARVYSSDSGFLLKDGRTARLFLDGNFAGEWETSRNSNFADDFDDWSKDRNAIIAANFDDDDDKDYYDSDIYGADDLDRYGDWVYISDYGHVWRPSSRSLATYLNWSPYRYGQWRWLPYYGWTWVNYEPWGWATYHYGRWIFHRGRWYWSPHTQYRRGRSWWRPALVFVTYIGDNFCWYPLPYGYRYYNYNRRFNGRWGGRRGGHGGGGTGGGTGGGGGGGTTPTGTIYRSNRQLDGGGLGPPSTRVPPTGVVSVPAGQFGSRNKGFGIAPLDVARKVLVQNPTVADSPPILPDRTMGRKVQNTDRRRFETKTGAAPRKTEAPLDEKLQRTKIYGNRTPIIASPDDSGSRKTGTGAFDRRKDRKVDSQEKGTGTVYTPPISANPSTTRDRNTTQRKQAEPVPKPRPNPTYVPRTKQPERKPSPPPARRSPPVKRSSPPPSRPAPKPSTPSRPAPKPSAPKESPPPSKPKTSTRKPPSQLN